MKIWYFRDYVNHRGENEIATWVNGLPVKDRAAIRARISFIEVLKELERPAIAALKGKCRGLYEVRISGIRVAYRPICYRGPGTNEITLLVGAVEKDGKLDPLTACDMAFARIKAIQDGRGRTCEHI